MINTLDGNLKTDFLLNLRNLMSCRLDLEPVLHLGKQHLDVTITFFLVIDFNFYNYTVYLQTLILTLFSNNEQRPIGNLTEGTKWVTMKIRWSRPYDRSSFKQKPIVLFLALLFNYNYAKILLQTRRIVTAKKDQCNTFRFYFLDLFYISTFCIHFFIWA